jgi:metal-sulfur cluster biosynthetic enzyme
MPETSSLTKEIIIDALRSVYDPEIPVNIVELGLIYDVVIVDDWVGIKMTLTTPGCGMADYISDQARKSVLRISGVSDADVRIVWDPVWTPARISDDAKKKLGIK